MSRADDKRRRARVRERQRTEPDRSRMLVFELDGATVVAAHLAPSPREEGVLRTAEREAEGTDGRAVALLFRPGHYASGIIVLRIGDWLPDSPEMEDL